MSRRLRCLVIFFFAVHVCEVISAQDAPVFMQFDLPAQPLGDSLRAIGMQTNTNVLFDPAMVQGQWAPRFKARATLQQVLSSVLKGSELKFYLIDDRTVTLVRRRTPVPVGDKTSQLQQQ